MNYVRKSIDKDRDILIVRAAGSMVEICRGRRGIRAKNSSGVHSLKGSR